MADDQTIGLGTYGFQLDNPMVRGHETLNPAMFEEVKLEIGGNTAVVGDFVTYRGKVTAATYTTHRDVDLAVFVNADTQVTNVPQGWCGQIIRPVVIPNPSAAGVEWNPDVALVDSQKVIILKRGAKGIVTKCIMSDLSLDVLPGFFMCIGATAGEVRITTNTFTDTTPTTPELAVVVLEMCYYLVGMADTPSIDVGGAQLGIDVTWI